jgi:feruloyl esterase
VKDGLLNEPRTCKFDPATLLCKAGDAETCLTSAQLESVKRMYSPARTKSGELVFPGKDPGSETGWNVINGSAQVPPGVSIGSFQVAYDNLNWDWRTFDLDRDLKVVDEKVGVIINAINPDLSAFKARGGKLILYHGWNDQVIFPEGSINYQQSVADKLAAGKGVAGVQDFFRLFMVPGMAHCRGGVGTDRFDAQSAIEAWVERGQAPASIAASRMEDDKVTRTRPLCPYPQVAKYDGSGDTNDAANFRCE